MTELTFSTADADDGYVWQSHTTAQGWPPATNTEVGRSFAEGVAWAQRTWQPAFVNTEYNLGVSLFKWNTSALPDEATVLSAQLRVYSQWAEATQVGSQVKMEWYVFNGTNADQTQTITANAHAGENITNYPLGGYRVIPLINPTNVSSTGYTGLRVHIDTLGATPTGSNTVGFSTSEHATDDAPRLIVYYYEPGDGPGNAYIQLGP